MLAKITRHRSPSSACLMSRYRLAQRIVLLLGGEFQICANIAVKPLDPERIMITQHSDFMLEISALFQLRIDQLLPFGLIAGFAANRFIFNFLFDLPVFSGDAKPECFQAGRQSC